MPLLTNAGRNGRAAPLRSRSKKPKRDPRKYGADCDNCPIPCKPVFARISKAPAKLAIVGEAPGRQEEDKGRFFVGRSGKRLDATLSYFEIPRYALHINNALLCRPRKKLNPNEWRQAIACCRPRLQRDLKKARCKNVLALGKRAQQTLTGRAILKDWIGAPYPSSKEIPGYSVLSCFHPAFCMRSPAYWPVFYLILERAWLLASGKLKRWKWPPIFIEPNLKMVKALQRLRHAKLLGMDIETAGKDPIFDDITAIGLASSKLAVSVPWPPERFSPTKAIGRKIKKLVAELLENEDIEKAAQNGLHDLIGLREEGIKDRGYKWDTLLLHAVAAPALRHDLGFICSLEFHCERWKSEFHVSGDHKGLERFAKALSTEDGRRNLCTYNGKDTIVLPWLVVKLVKRLKEDTHRGMELYEGYLRRSLIALKMRTEGALTHRENMRVHYKSLQRRRAEALRDLRAVARLVRFKGAASFNPRSKKQVNAFFFTKLKVRPTRFSEKTGRPSLDAKALQDLILVPKLHVATAARALLKFRRWDKLLQTYIVKLPRDENGVIHAEARVHGTKGGRWSYKNPNLQNIPKPKFRKGQKGQDILIAPGLRDIIRSRPGNLLIECDYSQLELRIMALLSNDPILLKLYNSGVDVHRENAKALFNTIDPTEQQRDLAKRFVYAVNYGGDPKNIWAALVVDFEGLTLSDVERLYATWYRLHPRIKQWQREQLIIARTEDYSQCPISGRRQYFFGFVEPNKVYNFPIQGSAADIIDAAIEKIAPHIRWSKREFLLFQIHDALVAEGPNVVRLARLFKRYMEAPVTLGGASVTFPIDYKIGETWGDASKCKSIEEIERYQRKWLRSQKRLTA